MRCKKLVFRYQAYQPSIIAASNMNDRFNNHLNTARLTYGAGVVTNFLGAKMELNYCIPVKHQPQDKVCNIKPQTYFIYEVHIFLILVLSMI